MVIITDANHKVVSVSLIRGVMEIPETCHVYENLEPDFVVPNYGDIYPKVEASNGLNAPNKLNKLSLSDLRCLQEIAFEFSIDREMYEQHDFWVDVQNQVEAEIKSRVVGIFGEPKS